MADSMRQALVLLIAMNITSIQLIPMIGQRNNRLVIDVKYICDRRYIYWGVINIAREERRTDKFTKVHLICDISVFIWIREL